MKPSRLCLRLHSAGDTVHYKFLHIDCKSCKFDVRDAHYFFDYMLGMRSSPPISCFNLLLGALINRGAVFSAFGLTSKMDCRPNTRTFDLLVKGLCLEKKVVEAASIFPKMIRLGCNPNIVTYNTMIDKLCKTGSAASALQMHRKIVAGSARGSDKPRMSTNDDFSDGFSKEGPRVDVKGLFIGILDGYCKVRKMEEAMSLYKDMNQKVEDAINLFSDMENVDVKQNLLDSVDIRG